MASILLTDPVLEWLTPAQRHALRGLNRQHRDVIDEHTKTQTSYTVPMHPTLSWRGRELLYERHTNVQALTFECGGPDTLDMYLRPTLQSLHLRVPLLLDRDLECPEVFQWSNADDIARELGKLEKFFQTTPAAQLHTLSISFHPTVNLTLLNDRSVIVDYDRYGPVYEDMDTTIEDPYGSPEIYFSVIEPSGDMAWIGEVLTRVCKAREWRSISLPAEFPGAKDIPSATLTEPCSKDEDIVESLWEHISELRFRSSRTF